MGYTYIRKITIDRSKLASTVSNFSLMISGTYSYLATRANSGLISNSNGYDIAFFSDPSLTTSLSHSIESYSVTTGAIIMHVNVPSSLIDVYMGYNDSGISVKQTTSSSAYDSSYKLAVGMGDGTTLSTTDETVNANNGTATSVTATSGQVGGAGSFNGTTSYIDYGNGSSLQITGAITLEAWIYPVSAPTLFGVIVGKGYDNTYEGYYLRLTSTMDLQTGTYAGGVDYQAIYTGMAVNNWYHVAGIYTGSAWQLYVNGALVINTAGATGAAATSKTLMIGATDISGTVTRFFPGKIDHVRVSNVARSADYIRAAYNNQVSPSTFYSVSNPLSLLMNVTSLSNLTSITI